MCFLCSILLNYNHLCILMHYWAVLLIKNKLIRTVPLYYNPFIINEYPDMLLALFFKTDNSIFT